MVFGSLCEKHRNARAVRLRRSGSESLSGWNNLGADEGVLAPFANSANSRYCVGTRRSIPTVTVRVSCFSIFFAGFSFFAAVLPCFDFAATLSSMDFRSKVRPGGHPSSLGLPPGCSCRYRASRADSVCFFSTFLPFASFLLFAILVHLFPKIGLPAGPLQRIQFGLNSSQFQRVLATSTSTRTVVEAGSYPTALVHPKKAEISISPVGGRSF